MSYNPDHPIVLSKIDKALVALFAHGGITRMTVCHRPAAHDDTGDWPTIYLVLTESEDKSVEAGTGLTPQDALYDAASRIFDGAMCTRCHRVLMVLLPDRDDGDEAYSIIDHCAVRYSVADDAFLTSCRAS